MQAKSRALHNSSGSSVLQCLQYESTPSYQSVCQPNYSQMSHSMSANRMLNRPQYEPLLRPSDVRRSVSARYSDRPPAFSQPRPSLDAFERFVSSSRQFTPAAAPMKVNNLRDKRTIRSSVGTGPRLQPLSSSLNFGRGSRQYTDVLPLYRSSNDSTLRSYMKQRPTSKRSVGGDLAVYEIAVRIGDRPQAGSAANLYIRLNGRSNRVQRQKLMSNLVEDEQGNRLRYAKGSRYIFTIRGPSLRDITSCVIEVDALLEDDSIFIEDIRIENMRTGAKWTFHVDDWLSLYIGDCKASRLVFADDNRRQSFSKLHMTSTRTSGTEVEYDVKVLTGTKFGSGTNANVFITIFGANNQQTARLPLKSENDPFERGKTDMFTVRGIDVGKIEKIRVEHDNSGRSAGWYLDHIVVTNRQTNQSTYAPCNEWLAKDEGDGRIMRDLVPRGAKSGHEQKNYKFDVKTGTVRGAGTDANVFVHLFGDKGDSGEIQLTASGNLFESGDIDPFEYELPNLGKLQRLRVWHDNAGLAAGRYLDSITVTCDSDRPVTFECHKWLAKDEADGQIVRDLLVGGGSGAVGRSLPYVITTKTGDVRSAGTNAHVYVEMYGEDNTTSGRVMLDGGSFERAGTDKFNVDVAGQFSPLSKLIVGHDDDGLGAGWYLECIDVYSPITGITQHFPCAQWFATDESDGLIERELTEDKHRRITVNPAAMWKCIVYTGDLAGAGTNSNVKLMVYGQSGKHSGEISLECENGDPFERGAIDEFDIELQKDLGLLSKMRVWHDDKGTAAGWFLDKIELKSLTTNASYEFECDRWLATDEDDGEIMREMPANSEKLRKPLKLDTYKVDVLTGDKFGAGTDANVYCQLFGKLGDTGRRQLRKSAQNMNKFERKQLDSFTIEAVDLGDLTSMIIGHDGAGVGAGWHLDKITVTQQSDGHQTVFACNRWLANDEDDKKIERELFPDGKRTANEKQSMSSLSASRRNDERKKSSAGRPQRQELTRSYTLHVFTSDVRGAGTDANVYATIYGSEGDTGEVHLNESSTNKTKYLQLDAHDIGRIVKLNIRHDDSGFGAAWHLDRVELEMDNERFVFPCEQWLSAKDGDGQISRDLLPLTKKQMARPSTAGVSKREEFELEMREHIVE